MGGVLRRAEVSIVSPLRYPGAKRRLSGYIAEAIKLNAPKPRLLVEPFAGGASVALQLLNDGLVDQIALGERDPMVASFWKIVFTDPEWLVDRVQRLSITLDRWDEYRERPGATDRERALACLFLNRTSFSGILARGAGPIGGRRQASAYKIDCRFNVETIVRRIRQAAQLRSEVLFVECASWRETIDKVRTLRYPARDILYYFDPPFYNRAERLYRYYFEEKEHRELHDTIMTLRSPWLLSYDPAAPIIAMYSHNGRGPRHVDLLYSVRGSGSPVEARELIISNLKRLPTRTRLWRSSEEWGLPAERARATPSASAPSKTAAAACPGGSHG